MGSPTAMHREDVKAEIRKRFGSVANFERAAGLSPKSVNDVLRGRPSARVVKAIKEALRKPVSEQSEHSDNSSEAEPTHRQNAEAR